MWVHKNSGKTYNIIQMEGMVKLDGKWQDCVIYTSTDGSQRQMFVRPTEDFKAKFVYVEDIPRPRTPYQKAGRGY